MSELRHKKVEESRHINSWWVLGESLCVHTANFVFWKPETVAALLIKQRMIFPHRAMGAIWDEHTRQLQVQIRLSADKISSREHYDVCFLCWISSSWHLLCALYFMMWVCWFWIAFCKLLIIRWVGEVLGVWCDPVGFGKANTCHRTSC